MDPVIVFDLRGDVAHFRRPDTLGTHASYPFIPRTALRGLIGAVLGLGGSELLPAEARCGVRLLSPVRTVAQELSLHGKKWIGAGPNDSFHRPTTIELIIQPHYRIYYAGPQERDLSDLLESRRSCYPTYLGSAFCLTVPEWRKRVPAEPVPAGVDRLSCITIVPSVAVKQFDFVDGRQYARVGGLMRDHLGGRSFRGTVSVIYEPEGGPIAFQPVEQPTEVFWEFRKVPNEGVVCLW